MSSHKLQLLVASAKLTKPAAGPTVPSGKLYLGSVSMENV